MFCSCRISTDKCLAWSLCNSRTTCFTRCKAISVSTGSIFTIFSPNGRYLRELYLSAPFFQIPQGTLPWQLILCHKQYTNHDFCNFYTILKVLGVDARSEIFSISQGTLPWQPIMFCTGLVRSEPKYLRIRWTDFHNLCTNSTFFFRHLNGCCHGKQFSGKNGAKLPTPALIALSFQNEMGYHLANMRINSSTNCTTLFEKMVKIGSVVFELKWGRK